MTVKVSVVVATYNSPPGLDGLVASLDAQSLPDDEYEVVLVDDGSTDDTFERITRLAAERSNLQVTTIPNSGWPGRPRNVGTRMASGEYVFYADHDDYFFPEALERMHAFAVAHDLDVLHPKEVVKGWGRPGWVAFRDEHPRVERLDQVVLQCITPHKLYRRSFLLEKQIWFPEGRVRLEDFHINGQAWAQTDAVGVLADYPCYQWIIHQDNSHKASYDFDIYWSSFLDSLQAVLAMADGPKKDQLLIRWYKSRILERVAGLDRYDEDHLAKLLDTWAGLLVHFPEHLDAHLTPAERARSYFLRRGDREAMAELAVLDRALHLDVTDVTTTWDGSRLRVTATATMVGDDGAPFLAAHTDGRLARDVPASLSGRVPEADASVWDLTDALQGTFGEVVVRARETAVDWILHGSSEVETPPPGATGPVRVRVAADVDVRTVEGGRPLSLDVHDVFVRVNGLGYTPTTRLPAPVRPASAALVDGVTAVPFETAGGNLAIDTSGEKRNVVAAAAGSPAVLRRTAEGTVLDLPDVHVVGRTDLAVSLRRGDTERPGRLVGRDGAGHVQVDGPLDGGGPLRVTVHGRQSAPVAVVPDGAAAGVRSRIRPVLGRARRWVRRRAAR